MKLVEVFLRAASPEEIAYGVVAVQRREGREWRTIQHAIMRSDQSSTRRTMLLEDNERLVIEGTSNNDTILTSQNVSATKLHDVTDAKVEEFARALVTSGGPPPGPLPAGTESQIGVWRVDEEADWSRTGARYRIY